MCTLNYSVFHLQHDYETLLLKEGSGYLGNTYNDQKRQRLQIPKSQRCLHGSYLNRVDFSSFLEKDVSFNRRLKIEVRIYIWEKHGRI